MASNHTEHFSLNQWLPDDQVKHTDFNEDNAKIDMVLMSRLSQIEIIHEETLTRSADSVRVDLSFLDWNQWSVVSAGIWFPKCGSSEHISDITLDGITLEGGVFTYPGFRQPGSMMMLMFPCRNSNRRVHVLGFPNGDIAYARQQVNQTYADIKAVCFSISRPLSYPVGTDIAICGIR